MHRYATDRAPTILVRHKGGRIAQSTDGRLVVTPGTIVHLECLFVRRFGQPQWEFDNYSGRTYPQVRFSLFFWVVGLGGAGFDTHTVSIKI